MLVDTEKSLTPRQERFKHREEVVTRKERHEEVSRLLSESTILNSSDSLNICENCSRNEQTQQHSDKV